MKFFRYRGHYPGSVGDWEYGYSLNDNPEWEMELIHENHPELGETRSISFEEVVDPPLDWLRIKASESRDLATQYKKIAEELELFIVHYM